MGKKRIFISFDYEHDEDLRHALVGQSKYPNSPFEFENWSVKKHLTGNWKEKVRRRIRRTDLTIVICGEHTHTAEGVADELAIAREEGKPYFLLRGRKGKICTKPKTAFRDDDILVWTWDNLRKHIADKTFIESVIDWLDTPTPWILAGGVALGLLIWRQKKRDRPVQRRQPVETSFRQTWLDSPDSWKVMY